MGLLEASSIATSEAKQDSPSNSIILSYFAFLSNARTMFMYKILITMEKVMRIVMFFYFMPLIFSEFNPKNIIKIESTKYF